MQQTRTHGAQLLQTPQSGRRILGQWRGQPQHRIGPGIAERGCGQLATKQRSPGNASPGIGVDHPGPVGDHQQHGPRTDAMIARGSVAAGIGRATRTMELGGRRDDSWGKRCKTPQQNDFPCFSHIHSSFFFQFRSRTIPFSVFCSSARGNFMPQ